MSIYTYVQKTGMPADMVEQYEPELHLGLANVSICSCGNDMSLDVLVANHLHHGSHPLSSNHQRMKSSNLFIRTRQGSQTSSVSLGLERNSWSYSSCSTV